VKKVIVAKLEILYTKLPGGTEADHTRLDRIKDIRAEIRTLYDPTASKKRSSVSQHI
jgi:hypothetical protein